MKSFKEHRVIRVDDLLKSAAFYQALFEVPPAHRGAGATVFEVDSPPLVITLEERPRARHGKTRRAAIERRPAAFDARTKRGRRPRWAVFVADPWQVGDAAIRLRRAGARLWVQDRGIETQDPDGNAWQVCCAAVTPGPRVETTRGSKEPGSS
jgi:catechol 2,3-dioxygenase-like lactoylglutathione lyase family enzyme